MLEHFEILELEEKWNKYSSSKKNGSYFSLSNFKKINFDKTIVFLTILISVVIGAIIWILFSSNEPTKKDILKNNEKALVENKNTTDKSNENIVSNNFEISEEINDSKQMAGFLKINSIGIDSSSDSGGFVLNNSYNNNLQEKNSNFQSIPKDEIIDFGNPPAPPKNFVNSNNNFNQPTKSFKDKVTIKTTTLNESKVTLKDKFYSTNDITYSLMLSEQAYNSKNYEEAVKWALVSNEIDKDNAKSWILFAKSQYKLSHKKDALIALETYNSRLPNKEVEELILRIKNGDL